METVMHTIFLGKTDKTVHDEFVKFSKGEFRDKYIVTAKKIKDSWNIKTSAEYANSLVRLCLEKYENPVSISGVIVSTADLRNKLKIPIENVKQFMGIKQFVVNSTVNPKDLLSCMNELPKAFFALSFKTDISELKIKPKAPKSAKPSTGGEKEPKADFCSLKTKDATIAKEILFEIPEGKEISVKHNLIIKEIELPKNISDPVQLREQAVRKGTIKRIAHVDEKEVVSEKEFSA